MGRPFFPLLSTWTGGYVECPCLSTRGGEGVKIGSKLVHVVVECPLMLLLCSYFSTYQGQTEVLSRENYLVFSRIGRELSDYLN